MSAIPQRSPIERHPERPATVSSPPRASSVTELIERRPGERKAIADRVSHLFPRPETTEWDVRELDYDRRSRAELRA